MAERTSAERLAAAIRKRLTAARELVELIRLTPGRLLAVAVTLHVAVGLMPALFMLGIGMTVGSLGPDAGDAVPLGWLALALIAFLVHQVLSSWQPTLSAHIARRVDAVCSARLVRAATSAPMSVVESDGAVSDITEAHDVLTARANTPGEAAEGALALIARYTTLLVAVGFLFALLGPLFALAGLLIAVVNRQGQTAAFTAWGDVVRGGAAVRRRISYLRELATSTRAAKDVRLLGLLPWLDAEYTRESEGYLAPLWRRRRGIYGRPFAVYGLLSVVAAVTVLAALAERAASVSGPLDLSALVVGVQALALCVRFGVIFPESDVKLVYGRAAWHALRNLEQRVDTPVVRADGRPEGHAVGRPVAPAGPQREIAFEGVRFGYAKGAPVLEGLDLTLRAGTSTALVGLNGAGKSTIVKLLAGLYEPDAGRVSCDGLPIAGHDLDEWRRRFAVTVQNFIRYELSLRDNVAVGVAWAREDDEGIEKALAAAGLGGLVGDLPAGLDTRLSSSDLGGRDLSGGQWQRIALARSLFAVRHGAEVLVLDEPTAQLDARGEVEFYDTFLELTRGVTSLIISHRFSTVRAADRIVILEGGRIVESGTHDELLAAGGRYRDMFVAQASAFHGKEDVA